MMTSRRIPLAALGAVLAVSSVARGQQVDPGYFGDMRWRLIGPYRAGNVYSVSGLPSDPTTYYIGTPEAGVWKTTDGGTVWKPIFDQEHVPSVGAVAVARSNPKVVYVGTGDPTGWSFTPGNGVYKSTDAGATWKNVGLQKTKYITSVIVDPRNSNIVLVGALGSREYASDSNSDRGLYRTIDGGSTWKRVLFIDANTGIGGMTADYANPAVIYAALRRTKVDSAHPLGVSIYKSIDDGATWHAIGGKGLPTNARFEIAALGTRVYAERSGSGRDASGLYRSNDGGATWALATKQLLSAGGGPIYVDPKNPEVLYLMGTAMYRSTDGGRSVVAIKGSPGGDDPRDLWIDPANPRRMLLGVDQGPSITVDGGETWTPWYNLPNGQFYHVSTDDHFPYRVCGAQQDSGTACVLSRSDFGEIRDNDWYPIGGFEDTYIVTDPLDDRWVYTQGWYQVLRRYDRETGQVAVVYTPLPDDRFVYAPPLAFSPQDPHTLYMGAQYLLASSDNARTWRHLGPDLTSGARRSAIETLAPSTVQAGEIWVGTNDGVIQVTRDNGATWTNVTPPDMPGAKSSGRRYSPLIDASHKDAGVAYLSVNAFPDPTPYIFRTMDFGAHWQSIVNGLPAEDAVQTVREDVVDPNLLFAGTVTGAWVSFDRGDHWQSLELNLPNTDVTDMSVHGNDLAISTYGRALWILDDLTPLRQLRSAMAANAYLYQPEVAYRMRWDNIEDTPLPPEVPAGENPPEGAIIDYYLKAPVSGTVTLSVYDSDNQLIRQMSSAAPPPDTVRPNIAAYWLAPQTALATTAGMHRVAWDLRYPPPDVINYSYFGDLLDYREYTLNVHAVKGTTPRVQPTGPLVAPGTYRIELTAGGQTFSQNLVVQNDPRIQVTQSGLVAQTKLQLRIVAGLKTSYAAFVKVASSPDSALANSAFGPANRDLTRHLEDMESGDIDPTPSDVAAVDADCQQIDQALAKATALNLKGPACGS
ncbi:MAG TPA: hypothetical protein VFA43_13965 [Gemmatimonadaceae bacterium]|nr:hypothetical protein [Gemmatimonadaceae bacterium]